MQLFSVEEIAVKATADPGSYDPLSHLVHALFVTRQDDKVAEIIQKYPEVTEKLQFQALIRTLRDEVKIFFLMIFIYLS